MTVAEVDLEADYRAYGARFYWSTQALSHQWTGAMFGAEAGRWICGDEMGLGKTFTSIAWLDLVMAKKVIVVTESGVVEQFAGEIERWAPHRTVFVLGKRTPQVRMELMMQAWKLDEAVLVVNYEVWRKDKALLEAMVRWQADTVIVDEAHNIKNTTTSNYSYIEALVELDNICPNCGRAMFGFMLPKKPDEKRRKERVCACGWRRSHGWGDGLPINEKWQMTRSVENVLFMTGTPILNSPIDLYPLLHLVMPLRFESKADYQRTYCMTDYNTKKWVFTTGGANRIAQIMAPFYLARNWDSAGVTPPPPQHVHFIPLVLDSREYPKQHKVITNITKAGMIVLDSGEQATLMHLMTIILRKRQANVHPGGIQIRDVNGNLILDVGKEVNESLKLDAIMANIEMQHQAGRRQVVFSQFKGALNELARRLKAEGYRVAMLDGSTTSKEREDIREDFYTRRTGYKYDILLANFKSGGTGLNLTLATATHELDSEWNPGKRDQARGRTRRMGQDQETHVFKYHIRGTIDTWLNDIMRHKEAQIGMFEEGVAVSKEELMNAMRSGAVL